MPYHIAFWTMQPGSDRFYFDQFGEKKREIMPAQPSILDILLVNRRFKDNALPIFLRCNDFEFTSLTYLQLFADCFPQSASKISTLTWTILYPISLPRPQLSSELARYPSVKRLDLYFDRTDSEFEFAELRHWSSAEHTNPVMLTIQALEDVDSVWEERLAKHKGAFIAVDARLGAKGEPAAQAGSRLERSKIP